MPHDHIQIFLPFNPTDRLPVCVRGEYVLARSSMLHSLYFDMQHDHVLKKLNFDLFTPTPGSGVEGGICG